jgi:transposase
MHLSAKSIDNIAPKVVPDTKLGDAVSYSLNQWDYLTRYITDGRMPIDNNILERDIRIFATGRKSWLFSDTADGAKASAVIYSLMLTCRACGVDPLTWLRHVLAELPQRDEDADISDLLMDSVNKSLVTVLLKRRGLCFPMSTAIRFRS